MLPSPAPSDAVAPALGPSDGRWWLRLQLAIDALVLCLACAAALLSASAAQSGAPDRWLAVVFPPLVLAIPRAGGWSHDRLDGSLLDATVKVLGAVSLAVVAMIALYSLVGGADPVAPAVRLGIFAAAGLGFARAVLLAVRTRAQRSGALSTPTLIIGAGLVGEHLARRLTREPQFGLRPVGFLDADPLPEADGSLSLPVLGGLRDLADAIERTGARHVVLAFSNVPDSVLVDKIRECEQLGVAVSLVPRLYEVINERASLDHLGGMPLLSLHTVDPRGWQFAVKHTLDRCVAGLALMMLAPLMAVIAVAVRCSSPGDVIFRQRRTGRDGKQFDVLKFRTMRAGTAAATGFELSADDLAPGGLEGEDRRTRVGRVLRDLSLDELPQLFNVLRGDMSLVGPRPERPEYVAQFSREITRYQDRHRVKSGITGWAQVNGLRGQTSITERVEWDNYYIQNWTLRLDLRILALTLMELLPRRDR